MERPNAYISLGHGLGNSIYLCSISRSIYDCGKNDNQYWGYNATTGTSLWNLTLNYPVNTNEEIPLANVDDFIVLDPTASAWKCYSMTNWRSTLDNSQRSQALRGLQHGPFTTSETNDLNNLYLSFPDGSMYSLQFGNGTVNLASKAIPSTEYTE